MWQSVGIGKPRNCAASRTVLPLLDGDLQAVDGEVDHAGSLSDGGPLSDNAVCPSCVNARSQRRQRRASPLACVRRQGPFHLGEVLPSPFTGSAGGIRPGRVRQSPPRRRRRARGTPVGSFGPAGSASGFAAQIAVDHSCRLLAGGDGVDHRVRAGHHVAAGKDALPAGGERLRIDLDRPGRVDAPDPSPRGSRCPGARRWRRSACRAGA